MPKTPASPKTLPLAKAAARAAADKKGEDVVLLNVARFSALTDYLVIASATSPAHLEALQYGVEDALDGKARLSRCEGRRSDTWRVLDYGGVMVHLMRPETREFYGLEKIFRGCRTTRVSDA
ncbi:MAG TPA: ribosome silencing factor [Elusimicrobia bacterium]|nr:ribosome silencing factor [Elusimicrobiota bacterium]